MEKSFWQGRWDERNIGFHQPEVNCNLLKHYERLSLKSGDTVFVPLCGKTLDISWFLSKGIKVVGVELVEVAVQELFEELDVEPSIREVDNFKVYEHKDISVFVGSVFDLKKEHFKSKINGVYDRAALVALPPEMRITYCNKLNEICFGSRRLIVVFNYDQSLVGGPPFSISDQEIKSHYGKGFEIVQLDTCKLKLNNGADAVEKVWLVMEEKEK